MAKVIQIDRNVVQPIISLNLHLSFDEAAVLRDMLYRTGGQPNNSRRKYATPIYDALEEAIGDVPNDGIEDLTGHLYFEREKI